MRVLVCGGRDFKEASKVFEILDEYIVSGLDTIIQGGAKGADSLAKHWCKVVNCKCEEYLADWDKYGKRAGYIRNKQMLEEGKPDLVIAFPGGKGTAMMIKLSKEAGVEVLEVSKVFRRAVGSPRELSGEFK